MGVVSKLKNLHKQTKIRPSDIPRVVSSGVDVDTYLSRVRTLNSYLDRDSSGKGIFDFSNMVNFKEKIVF